MLLITLQKYGFIFIMLFNILSYFFLLYLTASNIIVKFFLIYLLFLIKYSLYNLILYKEILSSSIDSIIIFISDDI